VHLHLVPAPAPQPVESTVQSGEVKRVASAKRKSPVAKKAVVKKAKAKPAARRSR
jgi:hypothetical protein